MAIKTNHSQESLTPASGVLKVQASGAVALPSGGADTRPVISAAGYIRFAEDIVKPEYYDGSNWQTITNKEYVDASVNSSGLSFGNAIASLSLNDLVDVSVNGPTNGQVISYDSTLGLFRPQTQELSIVTRYFQGTNTQLNFDLVTSVSTVNNLVVAVDGIQQEPYYSYTLIDGHILAFDEAPEAGSSIHVKILKSTISTDRARPKITSVSYSTIGGYTTITIVATDITHGTGAKIGLTTITRIDYPQPGTMQLMIENSRMNGVIWSYPQNVTLIDTSGNEFVFPNIIYYGDNKPRWTNSNAYIGSFSSGDSINFQMEINNAVSFVINPAYAGETQIGWLSISGSSIVGTAPQNSSPSRYEITVTASNGSVNITKNFWLLVI